MFYCQRLAPASVAMMVTPSHTLSQLPLAACQTVNGSAKAVTTRCHPCLQGQVISSKCIGTLIFQQSNMASISGLTSTHNPFTALGYLIVSPPDGGTSKGFIRESATSESSIWHVVSRLLLQFSDLDYSRKASPAQPSLYCKPDRTTRLTKAERQPKRSSTGKHQHE